jgi:hypothetical protein
VGEYANQITIMEEYNYDFRTVSWIHELAYLNVVVTLTVRLTVILMMTQNYLSEFKVSLS